SHCGEERTVWWNLYRLRYGEFEPLCPMEAEFVLPQWVFGMSTYAFESADRVICAYIEQGSSKLAILDTSNGKLEKIETPFTKIEGIRATPGKAVFIAASPTETASIVRFDLNDRHFEALRHSSELTIPPDYISVPQAIEFPTEGGLTAHAFFSPPRNPDFMAPENERAPLLVMSHGGPTSATSPMLRLSVQYW